MCFLGMMTGLDDDLGPGASAVTHTTHTAQEPG